MLVTPFKMARVAATVRPTDDAARPLGDDDSDARTAAPKQIVAPDPAAFLASAMRSVVMEARRGSDAGNGNVAGKTGTAQLGEGMPHSWFAGFAPYDGDRTRSIAFAVVVEHGGYGGTRAAPIAREIMDAATRTGASCNEDIGAD